MLPVDSQPGQIHPWRASCKQHDPLKEFEVKNEKGVKMGVQLQIDEMPDYLVARFDGASTIEEAEQQFKLLAEKYKCTNKHKLLLDFMSVPTDISLAERYAMGKLTLVFSQYRCSESFRRSSSRNKDRPAAMPTKGSSAIRSVQEAGMEDSFPSGSWK